MTLDTHPSADFGPTAILTKMRKGFLWAGIVMIVLGMAAVIMPTLSSLVVEILIGWLLTLSGIVAVIGAFSLRNTGLFVWELIFGLITSMAGLWLLFFPLEGLVALTVLVSVILMLTGSAQIAFALWARPASGWGWGLFSAIISMVLGGYILFALPEASAVILGIFVGVDFISTGAALVMIAWSVRLDQKV